MKILKTFFFILVVWSVVLYLLFGPAITHKVASIPEIENVEQLRKCNGYVIESLDSD